MSHWQAAKLGLDCSVEVLRRALIRIMPEWEQHLQIDEEGKLSAENHYGHGSKHGYKIVVKLNQGDIGFKQDANGSWAADYEGMVLPTIMRRYGVESPLQAEVAAMKTRAIASIRGYDIVADDVVGDVRVIDTLIPLDEMGINS